MRPECSVIVRGCEGSVRGSVRDSVRGSVRDSGTIMVC